LTARSLARACERARFRAALGLLIVVSAASLGVVLKDSYLTYERLRFERFLLERVLEEMKCSSAELYFAGRPDLNRRYGRRDLVHDDWLYPVFESVRLAEPRSSWLANALGRGSIRFVVNTSKDPRIEGLDKSLPDLGYVRRFWAGSLYAWERSAGRRER
jgi:hypothetical protein